MTPETAAPAGSGSESLPFLTGFGLLMTYHCQVACRHCIVSAGPHRTEHVTLDDAMDWIGQMTCLPGGRVRALSLTGGEPFSDLGSLRAISAMGGDAGLIVTAVTNAYWATTPEAAERTLASLPNLRALAVSADSYHQRAIPFERVMNAVRAAQALERVVTVSVCTDDENEREHLEMLRRLEDILPTEQVDVAIVFPVGRALRSSHLHHRLSLRPPDGGCQVSYSPVIFPNGDVIACIGPIITLGREHPLYLGNLKESGLEEVVARAQDNVVLHLMRVWGPARVVELLEQRPVPVSLPVEWVEESICHACYALMSDEQTVTAMRQLQPDGTLRQLAAVGRLLEFGEIEGVLALDAGTQGVQPQS